MADRDYLTVGEFQRTVEMLVDKIDSGFTATQDLQRETNGRLRKAEQTITVLSSARLIDRVGELEMVNVADEATEKAKAAATARAHKVRTALWSAGVALGTTLLGALAQRFL